MTIQIPDPGTGVPADKTGDSPWFAMKKVAANFSNQTHAASRLLGTENGQVPLSEQIMHLAMGVDADTAVNGDTRNYTAGTKWVQNGSDPSAGGISYQFVSTYATAKGGLLQISAPYNHGFAGKNLNFRLFSRPTEPSPNEWSNWIKIYTESNVTKDPNGFLKGASPIAEVYSDKMDLNTDATEQGGITFEKLGVGDYLVKGSLGFAQEGWYIETPKDANGNVLVAVVYEQLANNDISIKTYAKKFDDETGDIIPNLLKPRDIPAGRFISLRLHELPKEPPVMPAETQPEV